MSRPEIAWYVTRLARIPSSPLTATGALDNGAGAAECRRIGHEIYGLYGCEGMLEVWQFYGGSLDAETAAQIARAWIGIGEWQGTPPA